MKVRMQVLKDSKVIEDYTAPDGSWIQTDTLGAQHIPAITEPVDYEKVKGMAYAPEKFTLRLTPLNPPKIPPQMQKLLDSNHQKYGRNGSAWQGSHKARHGGTTLDRVREACWALSWRADFPLRDDPEIADFCETELGSKTASPSVVE